MSFRPGAAGAGEGGGCQPSRRLRGRGPWLAGPPLGAGGVPSAPGSRPAEAACPAGLIPRALARADTRRCVWRPPPCVWRRREGEPTEFLCHGAEQVAL